MKIVADDKIPFLRGTLEPYADVVYLPGKQIDNSILRDADGLIVRTRTMCNSELLNGTNVRFIATATIGFDHIDTIYCDAHGIKWINAPGCNSSSVQQYIASALLEVAEYSGFVLSDKTIGIAGVGNVGRKIEKIARLFGMRVLLNDPPRARAEGEERFVNLARILSESDIVTVHVPLNLTGPDKTFHLFNQETFGQMKKNAWFFNSSRGEVADSLALKEILESGKLGGTVLDVWENEPDIDNDLMAKGFITTPHIAGYSSDGKANGTAMAVNSLCSFFGLPLNDWYPDNIPQPSNPAILINCKGKSDDDILRAAVLHTYNITSDSDRLRSAPFEFEKQRGDYPLRREFGSYKMTLINSTERIEKLIESFGFKVEKLKS